MLHAAIQRRPPGVLHSSLLGIRRGVQPAFSELVESAPQRVQALPQRVRLNSEMQCRDSFNQIDDLSFACVFGLFKRRNFAQKVGELLDFRSIIERAASGAFLHEIHLLGDSYNGRKKEAMRPALRWCRNKVAQRPSDGGLVS